MALAACAAVAAAAQAKVTPSRNQPGLEILSGPSNAPVSIVVFSDYACPYSSQFYFQLEDLEKKYPQRLRVMLRQLPLPIHEQSPLAHEAALAAGAQGKLAEMSRLLFGNQNLLDRASLIGYASQLRLDTAAFRKAIDSHAYRPIVEEDLLEARALGITRTPTIFLNGHRIEGVQDPENLEKSISDELAKAGLSQAGAVRTVSIRDEGSLSPQSFRELTRSAAAVRGAASAPVTIVEFSDFQCPFCRRTVQPLEQLLAERPKDVRLVFRAFPLDFHQYSRLAHEAALAAGVQGKFWQMHDLLFANQDRLDRADLLRYAAELKLDLPAFESALDSHTFAGAVAADRALGAEYGVDGTPTLFINGKRLGGARSLVELEQVVDEQARVARGSAAEEAVVTQPPAPQDTDFLVSGPESAPVRVAWYTDVRSPLAQRTAALVRAMVQAYPGQLRVEYKTMQLANHPDAELANRALLAAGAQQKFWLIFDAIASTESPLDRDALVAKATALGLDSAAFQAALDAAPVSESIERDQAEEARRAILGSPAIFIGAVRIDGLQPERTYRAAIDAAIAAKQKPQTASSGH